MEMGYKRRISVMFLATAAISSSILHVVSIQMFLNIQNCSLDQNICLGFDLIQIFYILKSAVSFYSYRLFIMLNCQ